MKRDVIQQFVLWLVCVDSFFSSKRILPIAACELQFIAVSKDSFGFFDESHRFLGLLKTHLEICLSYVINLSVFSNIS